MGFAYGDSPNERKKFSYWIGRDNAYHVGIPGAGWHLTLVEERGDPTNPILSCHFTREAIQGPGRNTRLATVTMEERRAALRDLRILIVDPEELMTTIGPDRPFIEMESLEAHESELIEVSRSGGKFEVRFRLDRAAKHVEPRNPIVARKFPFDKLGPTRVAVSGDSEGEADHEITVSRVGTGWVVSSVKKGVALGNKLAPVEKIAPLLSGPENEALVANLMSFLEAANSALNGLLAGGG